MHMKAKSIIKKSQQKPAAGKLTVTDHDWGCAYKGTKEAIIAAGLVPRNRFPSKKISPEKIVHWIKDRRVTMEWATKDMWSVWVRYEIKEIAPKEIIKLAQDAVSKALAQLHYDIGQCKPAPLSQTLGIKAAQEGTSHA
jgi:hypothetical protein